VYFVQVFNRTIAYNDKKGYYVFLCVFILPSIVDFNQIITAW
jgi:hypothetical protein